MRLCGENQYVPDLCKTGRATILKFNPDVAGRCSGFRLHNISYEYSSIMKMVILRIPICVVYVGGMDIGSCSVCFV